MHIAPRPSTGPDDPLARVVAGPDAEGMEVVAGAVFGLVGGAAGAGARVLLRRMRRGTRVGPPGCELVVGSLWALAGTAWAAGVLPGRWVPVLLALGWFGVVTGLVDLRHRRLPDALTLPALPVALLLLVPLGPATVGWGAAGAAAAVGVHAVVHLWAPGALGAGDVKLAAPLGAVLGAVSWPALVLAAVLASVLTATLGLVRAATHCRAAGAPVPHGPSMLLATAALAVAGAVGAG